MCRRSGGGQSALWDFMILYLSCECQQGRSWDDIYSNWKRVFNQAVNSYVDQPGPVLKFKFRNRILKSA